jgi:hypothetical protein
MPLQNAVKALGLGLGDLVVVGDQSFASESLPYGSR